MLARHRISVVQAQGSLAHALMLKRGSTMPPTLGPQNWLEKVSELQTARCELPV